MNIPNSTSRFSSTVENYINFRPGYPDEFLNFMETQLALHENHTIADIGSGTGKLTKLFLANNNRVFGVEPNREMREAAEKLLKHYPNFHSLDGTAERTNVENDSIDIISVAQAFHWFDVQKTKAEFQRILKPDGKVLLIWNKRLDEKSAFMKDYNQFLEDFSTDLKSINLRRVANETGMNDFFGKGKFGKKTFEHYQKFDFEGVKGRYLSCSYAYQNDHHSYDTAMSALQDIFNHHNQNGYVKMWYKMVIYFGEI